MVLEREVCNLRESLVIVAGKTFLTPVNWLTKFTLPVIYMAAKKPKIWEWIASFVIIC